jgi:hypothetical protein
MTGRSGCSSFQPRTRRHQARRAAATVWLVDSGLSQKLVQFCQHALDVADNRNVGGAVLADLGRVDVHVDHLGVGRKCRQAAGHAVVEAHAQGDQHIALGHRHVGGVTAVHARHADEIRMLGRERAQTHQRVYGRRVDAFHELAQLRGRARGHDPAARVHQRPFGFLDDLRRAPDLPGVAFGEDLVARQMNRRHRLVVALALQHIFGDVHQHRSGPPGGRHVEGFMHNLRQIFQALHQVVVLGAGARDAEGVGLLKGVAADQPRGHLPGDGDDRNGIHHGVHQAGGQVGGARAGCGAAHAHLAGGARKPLRRERRILFVTHQHMADRMLVQGIVERQGHAARIAEDALDPFAGQALQQHSRAIHQCGHTIRLIP